MHRALSARRRRRSCADMAATRGSDAAFARRGDALMGAAKRGVGEGARILMVEDVACMVDIEKVLRRLRDGSLWVVFEVGQHLTRYGGGSTRRSRAETAETKRGEARRGEPTSVGSTLCRWIHGAESWGAPSYRRQRLRQCHCPSCAKREPLRQSEDHA